MRTTVILILYCLTYSLYSQEMIGENDPVFKVDQEKLLSLSLNTNHNLVQYGFKIYEKENLPVGLDPLNAFDKSDHLLLTTKIAFTLHTPQKIPGSMLTSARFLEKMIPYTKFTTIQGTKELSANLTYEWFNINAKILPYSNRDLTLKQRQDFINLDDNLGKPKKRLLLFIHIDDKKSYLGNSYLLVQFYPSIQSSQTLVVAHQLFNLQKKNLPFLFTFIIKHFAKDFLWGEIQKSVQNIHQIAKEYLEMNSLNE